MKASEYQAKAMRTLNPQIAKKDILVNAVMGLSAEAGEATDLVKKHLFQGHDLKKDELMKELGDIAWYLAEAATAIDVSLDEVLSMNIEKLKERFPDGFDALRSMYREKAPFYGYEDTAVKILDQKHPAIQSPQDLYDLLKLCWNKETCAPRMAENWTSENPGLGQCSITAFLVQDIFGGEVYGVDLKDGNYHCFNVIDGHIYDLTSAQFDHPLDYTLEHKQEREVHFQKKEKEERYQKLKKSLAEKEKEKEKQLILR